MSTRSRAAGGPPAGHLTLAILAGLLLCLPMRPRAQSPADTGQRSATAKTHSGSLLQGRTGATHALTVTNSGAADRADDTTTTASVDGPSVITLVQHVSKDAGS